MTIHVSFSTVLSVWKIDIDADKSLFVRAVMLVFVYMKLKVRHVNM
jgi:hypothetical protein